MKIQRLKAPKEKKILFLKNHRIIAKGVFNPEKENKELEKLFIKMCKQEKLYSKKTSDIDIYTGMNNIWNEIEGG